MSGGRWRAIILAAGRGPDDPMAKTFGVANKCLIPVGGVAMLTRVAEALRRSRMTDPPLVSIEDETLVPDLDCILPAGSAPASVLSAVAARLLTYPILVTTGDHPLLTPEMVRHFCAESEKSGADFTVGLARAETILAAYPQSRRTFFALGEDRVSGCNLFALMNEKALGVLERWQYLDRVRKKPWRLVAAFGLPALLSFALGRLSLERAFVLASRRLGLVARPVIMPFAEAAIDVDKPADKELAEAVLARRS